MNDTNHSEVRESQSEPAYPKQAHCCSSGDAEHNPGGPQRVPAQRARDLAATLRAAFSSNPAAVVTATALLSFVAGALVSSKLLRLGAVAVAGYAIQRLLEDRPATTAGVRPG